MPGNRQETKFILFSVLVHAGTGSGSGHYYVYIRPRGQSMIYGVLELMIYRWKVV